jgi:hypothetical protein
LRLANLLEKPSATRLAIVAVGLLGLAFALYQLAEPGALYGVTEYDDGIYSGSSVPLVHGYLPCRDVDFSMPPGITPLAAPIAAIGRLVGTRLGVAITRVTTALAAVLNCSLAIGVSLLVIGSSSRHGCSSRTRLHGSSAITDVPARGVPASV